jgi:hypothetical protein
MVEIGEMGGVACQFHLQMGNKGAEFVMTIIRFLRVWNGCQL